MVQDMHEAWVVTLRLRYKRGSYTDEATLSSWSIALSTQNEYTREIDSVANTDRSRRALLSNSSSLPTNSHLSSVASLANSSRPTLLMASLLARRRPNSSNRLDSKVPVDLMVSLVVPALFLVMAVWVDSRLPLLAMECLLMARLLQVKATLRLRPVLSPRTTSRPCRSAHLANRDRLTCRALVKDPLEVEASKVHLSLRLAKRPSRRAPRATQSLSRCLELLCLQLRPRPPLLRRPSNRSLLRPQLLRLLSLNRRQQRSLPTAALLSRFPLPTLQSPLKEMRQRPVKAQMRKPDSLHHTSMQLTPLPPRLLPRWPSLDLRANSSSNRPEQTLTT